jgi:hypothetical protein
MPFFLIRAAIVDEFSAARACQLFKLGTLINQPALDHQPSSAYLCPHRLEARPRPFVSMMIPPVVQPNPADIQNQRRDLDLPFHVAASTPSTTLHSLFIEPTV